MEERFQTGAEYGSIARENAAPNVAGPSGGPPLSLELALASVALGAVFALAAAPTTTLIFVLWSSHFQDFGRLAGGAAAIVGIGGTLFILACCGLGLAFGIMGTTTARREGRPIALALAGLLLNVLNLLAWVGILICWIVASGRL